MVALDARVTTWGVAIPGMGGFTVRAYWSKEDAEIRAGLAGKVTTPFVHPKTGATKVGAVDPLVFHHPAGKWVFAATGWDVPTVGPAEAGT
jgi:hypothetical protein